MAGSVRFELQLWVLTPFFFPNHCLIREGKFLKSYFKKNERVGKQNKLQQFKNRFLLSWPKSSFRLFHVILQKNLNELLGQPNILKNKQTRNVKYSFYRHIGKKENFSHKTVKLFTQGVWTTSQTHVLIRSWEIVGEGPFIGQKSGYREWLTNH